MTNLFALCVIVTSLTAAGLWSPSPASKQDHEQDVIVKEGHRVVVVEYGDQGRQSTKVSISPEPESKPNPLHNPSASQDSETERHRSRDLICDAFGKCKHKIANAVGKAKVMVSETAQDVGEAVADAFDVAKDTVSEKSHRVKESVEKAREGANGFVEKTKDTVSGKVHDLKEGAKENANEVKGRGEGVVEDSERQTAEKIKAGGNKLMVILGRGVKLVKGSVRYLGSAESLRSVMGVLSLLGFAMALGMGVWTTFISSYVLAIALPRQQLGVVQSKIYPVYFRAMASSIGMALLGHLFSHSNTYTKAQVVQGYVLLAALLMTFANYIYMEPQATKVSSDLSKFTNALLLCIYCCATAGNV